MNYNIAIPAAALAFVKLADITCYNALLALTCGDAFPLCFNGTAQLPCQSACQTAVTVCTPYFTKIGGLALLTANTQGCLKISAEDPEPYPTRSCFTPTAIAAAATNSSGSGGGGGGGGGTANNGTAAGNGTSDAPGSSIPATCPAYFLPAPSLNYLNTAINCDPPSGCCIPCPYQVYFYTAGSYDRMATITFIVNTVMTALMSYVTTPADIALHYAVAVLLWMAVHLFKAGNPRRIQCADAATIASARNNTWCAAMGATLIFAVHAAVLWATLMQILNVHLTVVWRSNLLHRHKPTATPRRMAPPRPRHRHHLRPRHHRRRVNTSFFAVQAVFVVPAVAAAVYTAGYVAYLAKGWSAWRRMGDKEVVASGRDDYKPMRSRQQFVAVVKANWRPLLLGGAFMLTYGCYIVLYNIFVIPAYHADAYTPFIKQWQACTLKAYAETPDPVAAQNTCADQVAPFVPPMSSLTAASVASAAIGLWSVIILAGDVAVFTTAPGTPRWAVASKPQQQQQHSATSTITPPPTPTPYSSSSSSSSSPAATTTTASSSHTDSPTNAASTNSLRFLAATAADCPAVANGVDGAGIVGAWGAAAAAPHRRFASGNGASVSSAASTAAASAEDGGGGKG
ncbi:hypothetical protein DFJ73DRAFT_918518 [Zopfochytrium polystomum]|nr:hypothetical protein DFJ73DRAFT_918518 [Zopfochytrium polystomum]